MSLISEIESFFHKDVDPALKAATIKLMPSIKALAAEAEDQVEKAEQIIVPAVAGAISGSETKSAAGSAAKAAVKSAAVTIGNDALSALVTALLTSVG